jgi:hypothetical protein
VKILKQSVRILMDARKFRRQTLMKGVLLMKSSSRPVRTAIVGLGFGAEFIPIHQRHPHVELVAICQRSQDKLDQIGGAHGVARRYQHYADVLKDADVDAVHIHLRRAST